MTHWVQIKQVATNSNFVPTNSLQVSITGFFIGITGK
jgi:hypothetical protein